MGHRQPRRKGENQSGGLSQGERLENTKWEWRSGGFERHSGNKIHRPWGPVEWKIGGGRGGVRGDSWFLADIPGWARVNIQTAYCFLNTSSVDTFALMLPFPWNRAPNCPQGEAPSVPQSYLQCHLSHEAVTEKLSLHPTQSLSLGLSVAISHLLLSAR